MTKQVKKWAFVSLGYFLQGHSKSYTDALWKRVSGKLNVKLFLLGAECDQDCPEGALVYRSATDSMKWKNIGGIDRYRKVIVRFFKNMQFLSFVKSKTGDEDHGYFMMDYEYISLTLFVIWCAYKKRQVCVLIHSAGFGKGLLYRVYKGVFFTTARLLKNTHFIVNGRVAKEIFQQASGVDEKRIDVIQYPSELRNFQKRDRIDAKEKFGLQDKKVFSLIGMIRPDKHYKKALQAFAKACKLADAPIHLLIAGNPSGVSKEDIASWVEQFQIQGETTLLLQYLSQEAFDEAFLVSDVLMVPYGIAGGSQSGPLAEARNFEIPVITLSGGEIGAYVQDNRLGLTLPFEDIDHALPEAILQLTHEDNASFHDDILLAQKAYSWDCAGEKYIQIFSR